MGSFSIWEMLSFFLTQWGRVRRDVRIQLTGVSGLALCKSRILMARNDRSNVAAGKGCLELKSEDLQVGRSCLCHKS